jgi:hypothetical protein
MQYPEDRNAQPPFTAAIRWRGPDPAVHLETRHPGFKDVETAAAFAAGSSDSSPQGLRLVLERVALLLNGEHLNFPYDLTTAWIRASDDRLVFESHPFSYLASYPSAQGEYKRVGYAVLGPDGSPVRMVTDFDNADQLCVTVEDKGSSLSPPNRTNHARITVRENRAGSLHSPPNPTLAHCASDQLTFLGVRP